MYESEKMNISIYVMYAVTSSGILGFRDWMNRIKKQKVLRLKSSYFCVFRFPVDDKPSPT